MTQITLPTDLESRVSAVAERAGTTTELLVIESLNRIFPASAKTPPAGGSLLDFLGDLVGMVDGPKGSFAKDHKKIFAEIMAEKYPDRKLTANDSD